MKIKLDPDTLSVDTFQTADAAPGARGTVQAHQAASEHCNSRQPFCLTPSVYQPCITDPVECG